jgi:hypothetical protein
MVPTARGEGIPFGVPTVAGPALIRRCCEGGDTDTANLVLLCYRHHWMIHEGGWQLATVDQGRLLAIPPSQAHRSWTRAPDAAAHG